MRTHSTRWARRRQNLLLGLNQGKDLNILLAPMGRPGAAKCSTCYIHPSHGSQHDRLSLHRGRRRQETTDRTDATSTSALGLWVETLLSQSTASTIGLVSEVDSSLGKSVLLTHFAQVEVCPGRATQLPVLLQGEGVCGETTSRSARLSSPLPRAILFWRVFPS